MSFENFLEQSWNRHADQPQQVAAEIAQSFDLVVKNEQISPMANLITHVFGEHLGQWNQAIQLLDRLEKVSCYDPQSDSRSAILRGKASLGLASGDHKNSNQHDDFTVSDQVRVLATAATLLAGQRAAPQAQAFFEAALQLADSGLIKEDPAVRALAVAGNNLAASLEEMSSPGDAEESSRGDAGPSTREDAEESNRRSANTQHRSETETALMILAATTARKYWGLCGSWLNVERAEYRLAMTYFHADHLETALKHAQLCLKICEENQAPPLELFFANEALAQIEKKRGQTSNFAKALAQANIHFAALDENEKSWAQKSLDLLKK